jgi:predicted nuclease with TOPRIM domain
MLTLIRTRKFPYFRLHDGAKERKIAELTQETHELRERLIIAQEAKNQAIRQMEELRQEKEKLRTRVNAQRQELADGERIQARLQEKILELQTELDALESNQHRPMR